MSVIMIVYWFYIAEPRLLHTLYYDYSVAQIYLPNIRRVQPSQCSFRKWGIRETVETNNFVQCRM